MSFRTRFYFWMRGVLYRTHAASLLQRVRDRSWLGPAEHETPSYWDDQIHRLYRRPNLNGRVGGALRFNATASLLRVCAPGSEAVLDLGCAYGDLAETLKDNGLRRYVGVDLSDRGIESARRGVAARPAESGFSREFHKADLRHFTPEEGDRFNAIVFNEVLKYFDVEEAVGLVERFGEWLAEDGVICITLSADPKCEAIFRRLERCFHWVYGTVYQQRPDKAMYRLTQDRANPAYLTAILRPQASAAVETTGTKMPAARFVRTSPRGTETSTEVTV
ncbi:MAG: methyltransferase domain-containing protein [Phycisphaerales bacterium]|nr:MAG: methyltransferase domain-containing protein [Phycisphaerales bacterium]